MNAVRVKLASSNDHQVENSFWTPPSPSTTLPKISIVTPSYNQGQFLEAAMRSVLDQNYPNLEYIVMDGGSTDRSVEIIQKYADRLAYWQSAKDRGQFAAITEGFSRATGEIYAYLNSDDMYMPWAFKTVARIFSELPQVRWLTSRTMVIWNRHDEPVFTYYGTRLARTWFYRGWSMRNHGEFSGWIQQEATFWRRSLWQDAGARMDETLYNGGDFELWARFWQHANLVSTTVPLAGYREHIESKTGTTSGKQDIIGKNFETLERYRDQTVRRPIAVKFLEFVLKHTHRGGKRFGSTVNWVQYDNNMNRWVYHSAFVI
jgi:glycosyltransferase involved in cell wall biosynthesis